MLKDDCRPLDIQPRDWSQFIGLRLAAGWSVQLLTFMFDRLSGNRLAITRQQARLVERAYRVLLTSMVRNPRRVSARDRLPIFIGAPDLPVPRKNKITLRDVVVNDGQHVQGLLLSPRDNRLKTDGCTFIERHQDLFRNVARLRRLHAVSVLYDAGDVLDYCTKSIERGRFDPDASIILPRSLSELSR